MAYPEAPVSADQVGYYFVQQYYQDLQPQSDYVHEFYSDASTIIRISGDSTDTASGILQIEKLIASMDFTGIEIGTINSLESLSGGVLVVVSGSAKFMTFRGRRKFMQTFLLVPTEDGYFILNDIFHFLSEEVIHQHPAFLLPESRVDYHHRTPMLSEATIKYQHTGLILQEGRVDYQHIEPQHMVEDALPTTSSPLLENPDMSKSEPEVEGSRHITSAHEEGSDSVNEYSLQDQQKEPAMEYVNESPIEDSSSSSYEVNHEQEPPSAIEDSVGKPQTSTCASTVRVPKGKLAPMVAARPYPEKSFLLVSEWCPAPEPHTQLLNSSSSLPDSNVEAASEGGSKAVYVKNLPLSVTTLDILKEFENFGRIKPDGVFIKNLTDIGICFAFVEFEDVQSVHNAINASPIQLAGREVYIEERKPSSKSSSNMSRRGRRGGSYQQEPRRGGLGRWSIGSAVRDTY